MKEFGSDFHYIHTYNFGESHLTDFYPEVFFLADGRQCIITLIRYYKWKRIWMPDYFCHEVIKTIKKQTGIEIVFYQDNPIREAIVEELPFQDGDVLFRMNYFGQRARRSNIMLSCPVIEDHTHDPLGDWALNSDADWCISSIRKLFPIPEGGIMWSPKGHQIAIDLSLSEDNEKIAAIRWNSMEMKAAFLNGECIEKEAFRNLFVETEKWFDTAEPSLIDRRSSEFISQRLDVHLWQENRRRNWTMLKEMVSCDSFYLLEPEKDACTMFSLVLLLDTKIRRDIVRNRLIKSCVYPAILWAVPECVSIDATNFSERMLSVHCDGRYSREDVMQLACVLNKALER